MDKKLSEKISHVKVKEQFVIWSAIILIVVSLLFPPYGYTKFTVTTYSTNPLLDYSRVKQDTVPWTYVKHKFIFSAPPRFDPNLEHRYKDNAVMSRFVEVENMQVAWLMVAIQTSVIILVASGVFITMRIRKGHIDASPSHVESAVTPTNSRQ